MSALACRFCGGGGEVVLDLGVQPGCKTFPEQADPGPDPVHDLRMWLCDGCGLAQLASDPGGREEVVGLEPAALVEQGRLAVAELAAAGIVGPGRTFVEYGSPHGGSWVGGLASTGATQAGPGEAADVVVDNLGMMHDADQAAALRERIARVRPGGSLVFGFHSLAAIVDGRQWNDLRHGHFAYYSTPALTGMLESLGFTATTAWWFPLYGGTVLLVARADGVPDDTVRELVEAEDKAGVRDPEAVRVLQRAADEVTSGVRGFLETERAAGRTVWGYSAASRAVALLSRAGIGPELLPAIADGSPAKQGRRTPGTAIPIAAPAGLVAAAPESVLLFVDDLLPEVRRALPEVEAAGGTWRLPDSVAARA
ncbi:class I SAM-dependent methyltransferase [Pseudonocardia nematodicida]|uniref:Class I SAM-dependent methyltransferase n=1 Tax=Pseudonocardia nematodicida TaxID=1206997 RepID=A0ABV1K3F4_9PSEU